MGELKCSSVDSGIKRHSALWVLELAYTAQCKLISTNLTNKLPQFDRHSRWGLGGDTMEQWGGMLCWNRFPQTCCVHCVCECARERACSLYKCVCNRTVTCETHDVIWPPSNGSSSSSQSVCRFAAGREDEAVMSPSPQRQLLNAEENQNTSHMFYS